MLMKQLNLSWILIPGYNNVGKVVEIEEMSKT